MRPTKRPAPLKELSLNLIPQDSSIRCLYCHDQLTGCPSRRCQRCAASYHRECAEACQNLGCDGQLDPLHIQPPSDEPISLLLFLLRVGLFNALIWVLLLYALSFADGIEPSPKATPAMLALLIALVSAPSLHATWRRLRTGQPTPRQTRSDDRERESSHPSAVSEPAPETSTPREGPRLDLDITSAPQASDEGLLDHLTGPFGRAAPASRPKTLGATRARRRAPLRPGLGRTI